MSHRCIDAFEFAGKLYPGGGLIADNDPILQTHAAFFAKVQDNTVGTETATLAPHEVRTPADTAEPTPADLEAWLAAETQWEEDVQAWLLAEEDHQAAELAAVQAAAAAQDAAATEAPADNSPAARRAAARRARGQEGKN
ncbi:hypothetical protein [Mycolicibacterium sp. A43C]